MTRASTITLFLREYLKDGEWHDESELLERALHLVDAKRAQQRYASRIGGMPTAAALKKARRAIVLEALEKSGAEVQRQWKRGPYTGTARMMNFSDLLVEYMSDYKWHTLADLAEHVPVRPEVAIRIWAQRWGSRRTPDATTSMAKQIYDGSVWYIQHAISDLVTRRRPPLDIQRRGKRGQSEYRLTDTALD